MCIRDSVTGGETTLDDNFNDVPLPPKIRRKPIETLGTGPTGVNSIKNVSIKNISRTGILIGPRGPKGPTGATGPTGAHNNDTIYNVKKISYHLGKLKKFFKQKTAYEIA